MLQDLFNIHDARVIIESLGRDFDSHDFIKAIKHWPEYQSVKEHYSTDADRKANSLVARFLSVNQNRLGIEQRNKKSSKNVNGNKTTCTLWRRH